MNQMSTIYSTSHLSSYNSDHKIIFNIDRRQKKNTVKKKKIHEKNWPAMQ